MSDLPRHVSVLPAEVLTHLAPAPGQVLVDATVGAGGHSRLLAQAVGESGRVIGIDQDAEMLEMTRPRLAGLPVTLVASNFSNLPAVLKGLGIDAVDGVLADLGICSDQLDSADRGFSFGRSGPLDMRLSRDGGSTAGDLIHRLSERDLANLIYEFGEERLSRRIAKRIVEARRVAPIKTTDELADLVRRCVPRQKSGIDPATRVFQALRIAVNDELAVLDELLAVLPGVLKPGGRAAIISFHSLEDRRVKQAFKDGDVWEELTRKPVVAGDAETANNPRSRSAKLRAARRK